MAQKRRYAFKLVTWIRTQREKDYTGAVDTGENGHHTGFGLGVLEAVREQHWEELGHDGPCHWWGSGCAGEGPLWCTEGTGMSWALVQLAESAGLWVPKALSLMEIRVPLASRCPWIRVPWGVQRGTLGSGCPGAPLRLVSLGCLQGSGCSKGPWGPGCPWAFLGVIGL